MIITSNSLSNRRISEEFRDIKPYLSISNILSALSYWIVAQSGDNLNIERPVIGFRKYLRNKYYPTKNTWKEFDYDELEELISEKTFGSIPEILELNQTEGDFIDLHTLARNVFYSIIREEIVNT